MKIQKINKQKKHKKTNARREGFVANHLPLLTRFDNKPLDIGQQRHIHKHTPLLFWVLAIKCHALLVQIATPPIRVRVCDGSGIE